MVRGKSPLSFVAWVGAPALEWSNDTGLNNRISGTLRGTEG